MKAIAVSLCLALVLGLAGCAQDAAPPGNGAAADPAIAEMISLVSQANMESSTLALQEFGTRAYPASGFTPGNEEAGAWIFSQLQAIAGLEVAYQSPHRNIIATLRGDSRVYIIGAHYDDLPLEGPAPGASDNGIGVAMVLEMARIMSRYEFRHTVIFAFWNGEEGGQRGSRAYVAEMTAGDVDLGFYHNVDSAAYDPDGRFSLDILHNAESSSVASLFTTQNALYGTGFTLTRNRHDCASDYRPFWENGYTATATHSNDRRKNGHSPAAHTARDRFSQANVSMSYAASHCQLAMAVLAESAGVTAG